LISAYGACVLRHQLIVLRQRKPRRSRRSNSSRLEAIGDNGRCQHVSENA